MYCRIRWYKVLRPPSLHVGHRNDRGPISLAGPGPPSTLRRLCSKLVFMLRQVTLLIGDVFCSFLLEQEAGHGMDVTEMKRIQLLIWQHAAKCIEVCSSLISCIHFYSMSALLAVQTAVIARGILSVRLSIRPSHSGVLFR